MTSQFKRILAIVGGVLLLLLVFASGWLVRDVGAQGEIDSLIKDREIVLQEIKVEKNREVNTLAAALQKSEADREVLLDQIASMKSKPAEIRYITKVKTVLVGDTTTTTELPKNHEYRLQNGLQVAEFAVEPGPQYRFETGDLTITANVVTGERDTSVSLQAESSLEPGKEFELPINQLDVREIRKQKLFEPHILLSVQAGVTNQGNPFGGASIGTTLLHYKNFDFVHLRAGFRTGGAATGGFDPVLYNVGERLPVFTNLWIGPGVQIDTAGEWAGTLTLGGKL